MGIEDNRQIDRAYAERLLAGDTTVTGDLAGLLSCACAPAEPAELTREDAAVAMFHTARANPARQPRRQLPRITRMLTAKVAAVVLVTGVGIGGVAVAASNGILPMLPYHHGSPDAPATRPARNGRPTASTSINTPSTGPGSSPSPAGSPSTALFGLCHAWTTAVKDGHTTQLTNPAFARLVAAAGGTSYVTSYCQALLARPAGTGPGTTPAPHPAGKPSSHPTGKPSSHPGGTPNSHAAH